jgi:hypothetical protein
MPVQRIRVDGFTITLDLELAREPETSPSGWRLFQQCCDAVKDVIWGRYPQLAHRDADRSSLTNSAALSITSIRREGAASAPEGVG